VDLGKLEFFYAAVIVVVLAGLAGYFGWRQWQALGALRRVGDELSPEDRRYEYGKAWRRLAGCLLMGVLALLFAGSYLLDLNERAVALGEQGRAAAAADATRPPAMNAEQKRFMNFFSTYWMISVLVLMVILCLAAVDLWAIRRYGLRHLRQIQSDRRAMLQEQMALLRRERNGYN
jgi:hypothetical protein